MNDDKQIEYFVKKYRIFIDTCSILTSSANLFWENIIPVLEKYNKTIIVPFRSIEELQKHSKNVFKPTLSRSANEGLKKIFELQQNNLVEIRGEKEDNFADNVFQVVFTKFRMQYQLLLITQDRNLAEDISSINNFKSVKANKILIKRINKFGLLSNF